ncbi:hypothetical protein Esti_003508 [Eimeria stiedai]
MPPGRIVSSPQSFQTEELVLIQTPLSTYSPTQGSKGYVSRNTTYAGSERRQRPWFMAVWALAAAAAVVFLVSYCRFWTTDVVGSKLTRRRLAGHSAEDDEQASGWGDPHVCRQISEELDQEQRAPDSDRSRKSAPPGQPNLEAVVAVGMAHKRNTHEEQGDGHAAKVIRSFEVSDATTVAPSILLSATEPQSDPASVLATAQMYSHPSIVLGKSHPVVQSVRESESSPGDVGSDKGEPLELPESMLEFYLNEALGATGEAMLESWLLDPEAPMPPSPSSEVSSHKRFKGVGSQSGSLQQLLSTEEALQAGPQQQEAAGFNDGGMGSGHGPRTISTSWKRLIPASGAPVQPSTKASGVIEDASTPDTGGERHHHEQAASSTSAALEPSGEPPYDQHPFYRIPCISEAMSHTELHPWVIPVPKIEGVIQCLDALQELLVKPCLDDDEFLMLLGLGRALASYAKARLTKPYGGRKASDFSLALFTRFLVGDQLFRVNAVAGQSFMKTDWWGPLMTQMLVPPHSWTPEGVRKRRRDDDVDVVVRIIEALDSYQAGERPSAPTVVEIKQGILSSFKFGGPSWDSWRTADVEFWNSIYQ